MHDIITDEYGRFTVCQACNNPTPVDHQGRLVRHNRPFHEGPCHASWLRVSAPVRVKKD